MSAVPVPPPKDPPQRRWRGDRSPTTLVRNAVNFLTRSEAPNRARVNPLYALNVTRHLGEAVGRTMRDLIADARGSGYRWDQIGSAMRLEPSARACGWTLEQAGRWFGHTGGLPHRGPVPVESGRAPLVWRCGTCAGTVVERYDGRQAGHGVDCARALPVPAPGQAAVAG